jgi:FAD binding domain
MQAQQPRMLSGTSASRQLRYLGLYQRQRSPILALTSSVRTWFSLSGRNILFLKMDSNCDVLITGAGPVGLTMASELSRYGLNVCIIDQNKQRTDKSKALVVWPRTLELMDRMGRGCVPRFVETGLRVGRRPGFSREARKSPVWT